jgi:hypothetical protein
MRESVVVCLRTGAGRAILLNKVPPYPKIQLKDGSRRTEIFGVALVRYKSERPSHKAIDVRFDAKPI